MSQISSVAIKHENELQAFRLLMLSFKSFPFQSSRVTVNLQSTTPRSYSNIRLHTKGYQFQELIVNTQLTGSRKWRVQPPPPPPALPLPPTHTHLLSYCQLPPYPTSPTPITSPSLIPVAFLLCTLVYMCARAYMRACVCVRAHACMHMCVCVCVFKDYHMFTLKKAVVLKIWANNPLRKSVVPKIWDCFKPACFFFDFLHFI